MPLCFDGFACEISWRGEASLRGSGAVGLFCRHEWQLHYTRRASYLSLSVYTSIYLSTYLPQCLPTHLSIIIFVKVIYLSICLSSYLFYFLPVCIYLYFFKHFITKVCRSPTSPSNLIILSTGEDVPRALHKSLFFVLPLQP